MNQVLDALCAMLDDELERQENVRDVCAAQGKAARAYDLEYLEAKTAALHLLLEEAVQAEQKRLSLVRIVVDEYKLPEERQTLTGLIEAAPEPWKSRLDEFQVRIQNVLAETRKISRENNIVIRRALRIVNESLACIAQCLPEVSGVYDARGEQGAPTKNAPNFMDQRG